MELVFIRHAQVQGNLEGRYIGRTDQPLCELGEAFALGRREHAPMLDALYVSPYVRCTRTAELLYPDMPQRVVDDLRECDFGDFEGKRAAELESDPAYAGWVASSCTGRIPNGELPADFIRRCADAVRGIIAASPGSYTIGIVAHGGTIMAALSALALPKRSFYEWRIPNCTPIRCEYDGDHLLVREGLAL